MSILIANQFCLFVELILFDGKRWERNDLVKVIYVGDYWWNSAKNRPLIVSSGCAVVYARGHSSLLYCCGRKIWGYSLHNIRHSRIVY